MLNTMTLATTIELTGTEVYEWLDREALVPTITQAGIQGDVSFLRVTTQAATTPIPKGGVVIIQGEGGHTHTLHGHGLFDRVQDRDGLTVGTLTVPDDAIVIVSHQEHGNMTFAPGTYRVGRQREFAGEWRQVAD